MRSTPRQRTDSRGRFEQLSGRIAVASCLATTAALSAAASVAGDNPFTPVFFIGALLAGVAALVLAVRSIVIDRKAK